MNRLPSHLQIETRHVMTALMGGEAACAKILATILVDAMADAGVLPETDLPVRAAPRSTETTSPAASNEAAKNIAASAPHEPAAERTGRPKADTGAAPADESDDGVERIRIKGVLFARSYFVDLWYDEPTIANIAERLGCSDQTVINVANRLELPRRHSDAWHAAGDARRRAAARIAGEGSPTEDQTAPSARPAEASGTTPRDPARGAAVPPAARTRCAYIIDAGRLGTATCLDEPADGSVYCARHIADVRRDRGAA